MNYLEQIQTQTDEVFSKKFETTDLEIDENLSLFDARCQIALERGLVQVDVDQLLDCVYDKYKSSDAVNNGFTKGNSHRSLEMFDYFYDHTTSEIVKGEDCKWQAQPSYVVEEKIVKSWIPFIKRKKQFKIIKFGPYNHLQQELSYRAYRRINKVKELNLFNSFFAFGHIDLWRKDSATQERPIILAAIMSLYEDKANPKVSYFYIN